MLPRREHRRHEPLDPRVRGEEEALDTSTRSGRARRHEKDILRCAATRGELPGASIEVEAVPAHPASTEGAQTASSASPTNTSPTSSLIRGLTDLSVGDATPPSLPPPPPASAAASAKTRSLRSRPSTSSSSSAVPIESSSPSAASSSSFPSSAAASDPSGAAWLLRRAIASVDAELRGRHDRAAASCAAGSRDAASRDDECGHFILFCLTDDAPKLKTRTSRSRARAAVGCNGPQGKE